MDAILCPVLPQEKYTYRDGPHLRLRRGSVAKDYSRQRPAGYMANESFHDELLSVH
jgi:hypothetical protein